VLVGLDGDGDVGVAEPLADDLDGDAFLDEQGPWVCRRSCRRMTGTPARRVVRSKVCERAWGVDRLAVAIGEDPPVAVDTDGGELGGPECVMRRRWACSGGHRA
jgi:hypothetical protein